MALIICPECGREFSDKAATCPRCACPIEYIKGLSKEEYDKAVQLVTGKNSKGQNSQVISDSVHNSSTDRSTTESIASSTYDSEKIEEALKTEIAEKEMARQALREYLEAVCSLEAEIYTLDRSISSISSLSIEEPKHIVYEEPLRPLTADEISHMYIYGDRYQGRSYEQYLRYLQDRAGKAGFADEYTFMPVSTFGTTTPHYVYEEIGKRLYEIDVNQFKMAQRRADAEYTSGLAQIRACRNFISEKINDLIIEKSEAQDTLQNLYDFDIIYPKYREIIPVSMFCEYIASGRCNALEGPDGMYNLYEKELLAHYIVNSIAEVNESISRIDYKLDNVSQQLTGVQRNQERLYYEIIKSNTLANEINENVQSVIERITSLDYSTKDISRTLESMSEANKIDALCEGFAHARLAHMDKMQTYNFKQMYPNVHI